MEIAKKQVDCGTLIEAHGKQIQLLALLSLCYNLGKTAMSFSIIIVEKHQNFWHELLV
jgi:GH24 family phage-related lysozyme (muramidase)